MPKLIRKDIYVTSDLTSLFYHLMWCPYKTRINLIWLIVWCFNMPLQIQQVFSYIMGTSIFAWSIYPKYTSQSVIMQTLQPRVQRRAAMTTILKSLVWSSQGSNQQPPAPEADALPLHPAFSILSDMVLDDCRLAPNSSNFQNTTLKKTWYAKSEQLKTLLIMNNFSS